MDAEFLSQVAAYIVSGKWVPAMALKIGVFLGIMASVAMATYSIGYSHALSDELTEALHRVAKLNSQD